MPQEQFSLASGEELLIEALEYLTITLIDGVAEIFGTGLSNHKEVNYSSGSSEMVKVLISSFSGGTVQVSTPLSLHHSKLKSYLPNVIKVANESSQGKILVLGAQYTGKSYAAKTVCNAVVGRGHAVLLVDLDPQKNTYAPGTISCHEIRAPGVVPGDSQAATQLAFFFGSLNITAKNFSWYCQSVSQMVACVKWLAKDLEVSTGRPVSVIFDAPPLDSSSQMKALHNVVQPDAIVGMGTTEQFSELHEILQRGGNASAIQVLHPLGPAQDQAAIPSLNSQLQRYFMGTTLLPLGVTAIAVQLSKVAFVKIDQQTLLPGVASVESVSTGMVLALSHAELLAECSLANVAGLTLVSAVRKEDDELHLLVPSGEICLPRRFLVLPEESMKLSLNTVYGSTV